MNEIWQTVAAFIFSISGSGAIIWAVVRKSGDILADRLSKKYEQKLKEEMEKYKAILEKEIYISQKHFDLELSIYRDLMSGTIDMTESTYNLFPPMDFLPKDSQKEKEVLLERYKRAVEHFNIASEIVYKNAPFIDKRIYESILNLRKKCHQQIICFQISRIEEENFNYLGKRQDEAIEISIKIAKDRNKLIQDIREYLRTLEKNIK